MKTLELYIVEVDGYATFVVRASGPAAAREFVNAREDIVAGRAIKCWHLSDDGAEGVIMASVDADDAEPEVVA